MPISQIEIERLPNVTEAVKALIEQMVDPALAGYRQISLRVG